MSERVWTKEQKDAINDLGHNLLVSAAAGSGKTSVLIERIIKLVTSGKASVNQLLVVTFTEAAASEMKAKLYKALDENGLKDEIELMPEAAINNFHSFANSVVKRYYHSIGLEAGLQVCDGVKSGLLKEEALDDLFTQMFEEQNKDFLTFLDAYETGVNSGVCKEMILHLYESLMSMPYPWDWTEKLLKDKKILKEYFQIGLDEVIRLITLARDYHLMHVRALKNAGLVKLAEKALLDVEYHDSMLAAFESNPIKALEILKESKFRVQTLKGENESKEVLDSLKQIRDKAKKCRDAASELAKGLDMETLSLEREALNPMLKIFFDLTKKFADIYSEKKRAAKCLDFSDMEHFALKILENEEIAAEYRNKFKFIFIDEYQDTNSLQETLIGKIKREDNLFMVGDVKQCIYKFRLAEPELFAGHYEDFKAGGVNKVIDLNANFRSKAPIINTVNEVFKALMTKESCDMEYDDAASLKEGSPYKGEYQYGVRLEILDNSKDDLDPISELKNTELAALKAASEVKTNFGKVFNDNGVDRPLDYKDMVVLLPQQKNVGEVFYKTFIENNIPVYLERDTGYFDTIEIGVFINLLKIIENIKQDIPLLSVLCCPIFGFTADDLAEIRLANPELSFSECFIASYETNEKVKAFLDMIAAYAKKSKALPLADFIYDLLLHTGYMDFNAAQNAGAQKLVNLKALVERAEAFERDNMQGLSSFISFAEALAKHGAGIDMGQAKTINASMNCVRIMTIHKSKGLEFPLVIVSGMEKSLLGRQTASSFVFHKKLGVALRLVNPKANTFTDTKIAELIKIKENKESLAEKIRILYVAMTRAKDVLILNGLSKIEKATSGLYILPGDSINVKTYLDLLCASMPHGTIYRSSRENLLGFKTSERKFNEDFERRIKEGFKETDPEVEQIVTYPYAKDKHMAKRKYSVSQIAEASRPEFLVDRDFKVPLFIEQSEKNLSANERGTAYHAVMEHIPFTKDGKSIEEIKTFIASLSEKNILTKAEAMAVNPKKIKDFFDSGIGKRAVQSSEIHKEAPFVLKTKVNGEETLVQGTIDCYFLEDDSYVLVDYKSNYVNKENKAAAYEHLKENYKEQLRLYKEALEKITGKKVKEAVLYLFGTSEGLEIRE